jgi:Ribbon-helix-helix protein
MLLWFPAARVSPGTTIGLTCGVQTIIMFAHSPAPMEEKPARLTVLIDADKKKAFDELCASQDITASQVVRQLIREYLVKHGVTYVPRMPAGSKDDD